MKPILFNTEMVRAILESRKTCTRRTIKGVSGLNAIGISSEGGIFDRVAFGYGDFNKIENAKIEKYIKVPYLPGDILYVRETWLKADDGYYYKADMTSLSEEIRKAYGYKWKPSIHMPKVAARIFLKIKDVRVERLQDINGEDSIKEGIQKLSKGLYGVNEETNIIYQCLSPRDAFLQLWNSTVNKKDINKYGRKANPWLWVIEFERISKEEAFRNE